MNTLANFIQEAKTNNLKVIQINKDANDYPSGLGSYGVIGFPNFSKAEIFCAKHGGEICQFKTREGHQFWRNTGLKLQAFDYTDYLDKCNDNVNHTNFSEAEELFWQSIQNIRENEDFEELQYAIENHKKTIEFFDVLKEDEIAIYNGNNNTLNICKNEFMQFSEDVYTYSIGVYFNPSIHESEEGKIYTFIEEWRKKNEYNPITLEEYNAKFRKEFNQFLDQGNFSEEIIKLNKYK